MVFTRQGGQTYYGSFTGAIDNQDISQNYTNSSGGPVVAFASATYLQNSGNSNYNSLQVSAERRARDITYLLSYTYAKSLDNYSAKWDPRDPNRAYGHSSCDMRHNLVISYNWNLPFDRFLGTHRYHRRVANYRHQPLQYWLPISLKSGGDIALTNIGLDYPNQIGPIQKLNPHACGTHLLQYLRLRQTTLSCGYETCGVTGTAKQFSFTAGCHQHRRGPWRKTRKSPRGCN